MQPSSSRLPVPVKTMPVQFQDANEPASFSSIRDASIREPKFEDIESTASEDREEQLEVMRLV